MASTLILKSMEGKEMVMDKVSIASKNFPCCPDVEPPGGWNGPFGFLRLVAYLFAAIAVLGVILFIAAALGGSLVCILAIYMSAAAVLAGIAAYSQEGLANEIQKIAAQNDEFAKSNQELEEKLDMLGDVETRMDTASEGLEGSWEELESVFQQLNKCIWLSQLFSVLDAFLTTDASDFGGDVNAQLSSLEEVEGFVDSLAVLDTVPTFDKESFSEALFEGHFGLDELKLLVDAMNADTTEETYDKLHALEDELTDYKTGGITAETPGPKTRGLQLRDISIDGDDESEPLISETDEDGPPPLNPMYMVVYGISCFTLALGIFYVFFPIEHWSGKIIAWGTLICGIALMLMGSVIVSYLDLVKEVRRFKQNNQDLKANIAELGKHVAKLQAAAKAFQELDEKYGGSVEEAKDNVENLQEANRTQFCTASRRIVQMYCDADKNRKINTDAELDDSLETLESVFGSSFTDFDHRADVIRQVVSPTLDAGGFVKVTEFSKLVQMALGGIDDLEATLESGGPDAVIDSL